MTEPLVYSSYLAQVADKTRAFYYRANSEGDKGVITQLFIQHDYKLTFWQYHNMALLGFMNALSAGGRQPLIVDAGANIGASAVWFALSYHPALILAIEPEANNCNLLRLNTADLNVSIYEAAIGCNDGELYLQDPNLSDWGFRVGETGTKKIPVISMQTLLQPIDFSKYFPFIMKIDIEGGEAELFSQYTDWLDDFALVIIELHDWMLPFSGSSRSFIQSMARYDFDILQRGENLFCFNRKFFSPRS